MIAPKLFRRTHGHSSRYSFFRSLDHYAVAVVAIVKFAIGWAANSLFKGMDCGLASGFSGLMDLQVLLGLIYFIWNGIAITGFPMSPHSAHDYYGDCRCSGAPALVLQGLER